MKHKRKSKRLWGVMLILAMAMVMMLGATVTASAAGVTDEAYDIWADTIAEYMR